MEGWVFLDNLRPFAVFVADCAGYDLLADEVVAIEFGVRNSDAEAGQWYEYRVRGTGPRPAPARPRPRLRRTACPGRVPGLRSPSVFRSQRVSWPSTG